MDADDGGNLDQLTENDDEDVSPDWGVPAPVATRTCDDEAATVARPEGTAGPDVIVGTPRSDQLVGLGGADPICGAPDGAQGDIGDQISGGPGADQVLGHKGHDDITGNDGSDGRRAAARGDDDVLGAAGNDRLFGDAGNDDLTGGGHRPGGGELRHRRRSAESESTCES